MSSAPRLAWLARHPRRSLGTLGVVLAAGGLVAGSGAFFSDTSASTGNTVAAGTLDVLVRGSGAPDLDANACLAAGDAGCTDTTISAAPAGETAAFRVTNLVPMAAGHTVVRRFAVENRGTVPGRLRLTATTSGLTGQDSGERALPDEVLVSIVRLDGTERRPVATDQRLGSISGVVADPGASGRVALPAGATYTYELALRLPESQSPQNDLQGQAFQAVLSVAAQTLGSTTG